jgi:hypothetical protein
MLAQQVKPIYINNDKVNLTRLSTNPPAIPSLEKNQDKIDWNCLSENYSIDPLEKNLDKIDWNCLSENQPKAFQCG